MPVGVKIPIIAQIITTTIEDIKKSRLDFHKTNRVVFMRNEFFGNPEDVNWFSNILRMEMML